MTTIKKGEVVTCPKCGDRIAEFKFDLFKDDLLLPGHLRGIREPVIKGYPCRCVLCGTQWWIGKRVHTMDGWKP